MLSRHSGTSSAWSGGRTRPWLRPVAPGGERPALERASPRLPRAASYHAAVVPTTPPPITITSGMRGGAYSPAAFAADNRAAWRLVLPLAGAGFALGWPIEWLIQRFPHGGGHRPVDARRSGSWPAITAALFAALTVHDRPPPAARSRRCS